MSKSKINPENFKKQIDTTSNNTSQQTTPNNDWLTVDNYYDDTALGGQGNCMKYIIVKYPITNE